MITKAQPSVGRRIARAVGRGLLALLAFEAIAIVVFRSKWRPAIDAVRHFNKAVTNPAMMRMAGRTNWYATVVRHVGRRSGKPYATPVVAEPAGDHLYIPLPYGIHVDWCDNVLAAGGCVVERRGDRLETTAPAIVSAEEAAPMISPRRRRQFGLYGIDSYLRLESPGGDPSSRSLRHTPRPTMRIKSL
jgi:deazaflavin-dependent oxidoreductase (nitroreductase family)